MKFLTLPQVAKMRGVTRFAVWRWVRQGLPAERIGSQWVVREPDARNFKPQPVGNPAFTKKEK